MTTTFVALWLAFTFGSAASAEDAPPSDSLHHLETAWTSAGGDTVHFVDLAGRPAFVAMFFSHCPTACLITVSVMKRIEAELSPGERERVRFVLVSLDPERDTPERLAEYAERFELDRDRWLLLHGEPVAVREIAAVLGVRYRPDADAGFVHSNPIVLLDAAGRIVSRHGGEADSVGELLGDLRASR